MSDVLVLNRNFFAIHVTSWRRAVSLLYLGHAYVVDEEYRTYNFEDWRELSQTTKTCPAGFIYTPHFKIAVPEVIALCLYDKLPAGEVTFTRKNIYQHYDYHCCYCGKKYLTQNLNLEHVVPKSRGGKTNWDNIVLACVSCNFRKGNKLPGEAGLKLLVKPSKPRWRGNLSLVVRSPLKMKSSWQRFVDNLYWNSELDKSG